MLSYAEARRIIRIKRPSARGRFAEAKKNPNNPVNPVKKIKSAERSDIHKYSIFNFQYSIPAIQLRIYNIEL
jgi:hypothetical protein